MPTMSLWLEMLEAVEKLLAKLDWTVAVKSPFFTMMRPMSMACELTMTGKATSLLDASAASKVGYSS